MKNFMLLDIIGSLDSINSKVVESDDGIKRQLKFSFDYLSSLCCNERSCKNKS